MAGGTAGLHGFGGARAFLARLPGVHFSLAGWAGWADWAGWAGLPNLVLDAARFLDAEDDVLRQRRSWS